MIAKKEFLQRFGLEGHPTLMPQDRVIWLLSDEDSIPTRWNLQQTPPTSEEWENWEEVLHQPETKKPQKLFLEHLAKPEKVWRLALEATEETVVLPIYLRRLDAAEALAIEVKIPANTHAKILFLERASDEVSRDENALENITIRAEVGEYAKLDVNYIHPLYSDDTTADYLKERETKICLYAAKVAKGGEFRWTSVNLGDSLIEKGEVHLEGESATANVGGASYVQAGAQQLYQAHVYCKKPYATCRIQNHGVVENNGTGTFVSISDIAKGAHATEAREDNRFMTLGEEAKAFADPTLLIDEYDVKASHAATVGQADEEALFYMQSRGLDRKAATRLLTAGFLTPLFDRIELTELRDELLSQFYEKMHLDEMLGEATVD